MSKALSFVGILAVAAVNGVVLFFSSLLAVGGDGNPRGVYGVLIAGGLFILLFTSIALHRWTKELPAVGIAAMALPAAWGVGIVFLLGARMLGWHVG
jgi:hypothetical protein